MTPTGNSVYNNLMPKMTSLTRPTDAELEVLGVLWSRGRSTVREVHDVVSAGRAVGYTSILKTMQIMTEKGFLKRLELQKAHIYQPVMSEEEMQGQLLTELSQKLFAGSPGALAMRALALTSSDEELQEIRAMIDRRKASK